MKLVIASILIISNCFVHVAPSQINTGGPKVLEENEDALVTCVVLVPNNNETVIWKRGQSEVLTAGLNRVTNDKRFTILHDDDTNRRQAKGDVWVLLIRNVKPNDTGIYSCELNGNPVLKSFHHLRVRSLASAVNKLADIGGNASTSSDYFDDLLPPNEDSESVFDNLEESQLHSYEDCCKFLNVSSSCLGFCTLQNILNGTSGVEPESCEEDFPKIIMCMADGRNHVPCCESRKVPDICQDICHGDYTPFSDKLKSRISCSQYTVPSLECILEGVRRIPSQPTDTFVEADENSMKISWGRPRKLDATVKAFNINVTVLDSFDEGYLQNNTATTISIKVPGEMNETIVRNLRTNTMYAVDVTAENGFGASLPSDRKRVFTLKPENVNNRNNSIAVLPKLPDIKKCCVDHGFTHKTCLDKMCDPTKSDLIEVPDMMVCAPWTNISFPCLTNGLDHKPCCRARGIPDLCLPFCDGTLKTINFNHFRCLQYMSDYSSCLMQGYGVLPTAPLKPKAEMISDSYAIINWQKPMILSETVKKYHLKFRKLQSDESYSVLEETRPPIILDGLDSNTNYEAFLTATNQYGKSMPSNRLVFKTKTSAKNSLDDGDMSYNITTCCRNSGLLPKCMNLCSYDIKMSDLQSLGHECLSSVGAIVRCASGGRDHRPCCSRRGVSKKCLANCKGILTDPTECISYAGNIIQCFEEGNDVLPGAVENLQARIIDATSIYLSWQPNQNDSAISKEYLVQYGRVDNMTMYETILKLENEMNTKDTEITLEVKPNTIYRIVVLSKNEYGTSLPSSELIINSSSASIGTKSAVSSPPHSLVTTAHGATTLTVSWLPPEFLHPNDKVSYRLYHRSSKNNVTVVDTKFLWVRMNRLLPRSQHIIYVVAITSNGYSLPSETLIAWTDPAIPAIVDPPTVQPQLINEGNSMNILCIALGNPLPNVKLYVGGHFVREDRTRHLVTTIHNVTRDMTNIACYADNGYGTASQASSRILINYLPTIQPVFIPFAGIGDEVEVKCKINSQPRPTKIMFWRDFERREPVINSEKYNITLSLDENAENVYYMTLKIAQLKATDIGDYFCQVENILGSNVKKTTLELRAKSEMRNITNCCIAEKVSPQCMSACSYYVDIDAVIDKTQCFNEFDKLMKCSSDGSDHRHCCAKKSVTRKCLNWCRGEAVNDSEMCALRYTRSIIGCFQENNNKLPGPPQNLKLIKISGGSVSVSWDPPVKNPDMVEGYRVFWHTVDPMTAHNNQTLSLSGSSRLDAKENQIEVNGLEQNVQYEMFIKAGNAHGASILSEALKFSLDDEVSSPHSNNYGSIVGGILALVIFIMVVTAILAYAKSKNLLKLKKANNGVAFENPSYLKEANIEQVTIQTISSNTQQSENPQPSSTQSNQENIQSQTSSNAALREKNPNFIERMKLKLGKKEGSKKLVP